MKVFEERIDDRSGIVYIERLDTVGIGQYAVKDRDSWLVFDSIEELQ